MKKIFITTITFFLAISLNAQFGVWKKKSDLVKIVKNKPLKVTLSYEDSKLANEGFDDNLKKAVNQVWKFSPSIEYISAKDYTDLIKSKSKDDSYAYLDFIASDLLAQAPGYSFGIKLLNEWGFVNYVKIEYIEEPISYGDIVAALQFMQHDLNDALNMDYKEYQKKFTTKFKTLPKEKLEGKTLLLDESLVSEKIKGDLETLYPYEIELVDKETIEKAVSSNDPTIIYFKKLLNASIPRTKTVQGKILDGTRHDNGMLKRSPDRTKVSALETLLVNAIVDAGTGEVIFFCKPGYKYKGISANDFKAISKALN